MHIPHCTDYTQNSKVCFDCRATEDVFKSWHKLADGSRQTCYRCDSCRVERNRTYHREYERERSKSPEALERNRNYMRVYMREYKDTARMKASNAIRRLIQNGTIPHPNFITCMDCGESAAHYHHPDYSEPESVVALCALCHKKRHRDSPCAVQGTL